MKGSIRSAVLIGAMAIGLAGMGSAAAHEAGDILLKMGVTHVNPKSDNGSLANDTVHIDVGNSTRPSFSLTYMATKNVGIELLGAVPFKHDIRAKGVGDIGSTKHLPPTLSLQWHFLPDARIQPYVGVGVNYTKFFSEDSSLGDLELSDSWGLAAQVGVDINLDKNWFMTADVRYIDIDTKVKLNGQRIGTVKIDPVVATVGVGYRF